MLIIPIIIWIRIKYSFRITRLSCIEEIPLLNENSLISKAKFFKIQNKKFAINNHSFSKLISLKKSFKKN